MSRPAILVVSRNFPPLTGGMERLMAHTVQALAERFDVTLIGPRGARAHCPEAQRVIECPASPAVFLTLAVLRGLLHCMQARPQLVLGGSGLVAPVTALLGRLSGARTLILVHGLDLVVNSRIYQHGFVPWIRRHDCVIANSANTRELALAAGCTAGQLEILHPGSEQPEPHLLDDSRAVRQSLDLSDAPVILFVGRIIKRKGLAGFLASAWPQILAAEPAARLLVVGDTPSDALMRDAGEAKLIQRLLGDAALGESVRFVGQLDDDMLWRCYALATALVFPLVQVDGDVEGFGMVAIEAAACGTPTVAFRVGGVADAVSEGVNGCLVKAQDYVGLSDALVGMLRGGAPTPEQCRAHARNFSWAEHKRKLFSIVAAA